jgi:hypothetical protein
LPGNFRLGFEFKQQVVAADIALRGDDRQVRQPVRGQPFAENAGITGVAKTGRGAGEIGKGKSARAQYRRHCGHRPFHLFADIACPQDFSTGHDARRAGKVQPVAGTVSSASDGCVRWCNGKSCPSILHLEPHWGNAAGRFEFAGRRCHQRHASEPRHVQFHRAGGIIQLLVTGDTGANFEIGSATNLIDWASAFTTNSAATPLFNWSGPATNTATFYRVLLIP